MGHSVHRSGLALSLAGVAAGLFFWLTDPRFGRQKFAADVVDRVNEAHAGTTVGVAGSIVVVLIGAFLMTRRTM